MTWTPDMEAELRSLVQAEYRKCVARDVVCTGKATFKSRADVEFAIHRTKRVVAKRQAYKCRNCGMWHMGGTYRPKSRRNRNQFKPVEPVDPMGGIDG